MPRGSLYTADRCQEICRMIAEGMTLREVCKQPGMPARSTVLLWLTDPKKTSFLDQYVRAREAWADFAADEILEIADDGRNDWMERKNADGEIIGFRENGDSVRRSALRVETRKWLMSKRAPKKYGDFKSEEPKTSDVTIHGGLPD